MIAQNQSRLWGLIVIGTPLVTGIMLLFHPLPNPAEIGLAELLTEIELFNIMRPLADRFLAFHALFALMLALLGLSVILLLNGARGIAASLSRVSAFLFTVTYIMYETIIGTLTGLLVSSAAALPPGGQHRSYCRHRPGGRNLFVIPAKFSNTALSLFLLITIISPYMAFLFFRRERGYQLSNLNVQEIK